MFSMIYLLFSLVLPSALAGPAKAAKVDAVSPEHTAVLMDIEEKYQRASNITMSVEKTDKVEALDQTRKFAGTMKIKKGKFRLELESQDANKDSSLIVADGKTLWLVTPPPKEFKEAKTQVAKVPMSNKGAKAQGFLQILTEGGILKHFSVSAVMDSGDKTTFYLQPKATSTEFRRAQLVANKKEQTIESLEYWDAQNNQTIYSFSKVDFQKPIDDSLLRYTPPKDADVMKF
jgi:outer membrane lipoprotein-sorting protein